MTNDDFMVTPNQASNAITGSERYDCYWHIGVDQLNPPPIRDILYLLLYSTQQA